MSLSMHIVNEWAGLIFVNSKEIAKFAKITHYMYVQFFQ